MEFSIKDLKIYFPFKKMYPEQVEYIQNLVSLFLSSKSSLIQLPPAISKSVCFFSVFFSWKLQYPDKKLRIFYAADSQDDMDYNCKIAKVVYGHIKSKFPDFKLLGLCIGEKKNLCIIPEALSKEPKDIEDICLSKIAPWNVSSKGNFLVQSTLTDCKLYDNLIRLEPIPTEGIFTIDDLKEHGNQKKVCPYYLSDSLKKISDLVICNYFYLNTISKSPVDKDTLANSLLFVDECTGLDERITELFTERITKYFLERCVKSVDFLNQTFKDLSAKETEKERLTQDYQKILAGLTTKDLNLNLGKNNPDSLETEEQVIKFPGHIRKIEHFIVHLKKLIFFLSAKYFGREEKRTLTREGFLDDYHKETEIHPDINILRYFPNRLVAVLNSLKITDRSLHKVLFDLCRFVGLAQSEYKAFGFSFETTKLKEDPATKDHRKTHHKLGNDITKSVMSLVCLSPREIYSTLTKQFRSVIMNTELLADVNTFQKILGFEAQQVFVSPPKKIPFLPITVGKGAELSDLSNEKEQKSDGGVLRNYSNLLVHLAENVPDGILVLFPSESYIKDVGLKEYKDIMDYKLVFAETKNWNESLKNYLLYLKACENGRGAVFLALINGRIIQSIKFSAEYTKCIMVVGLPLDQKVREYILKLRYLKAETSIPEKELVIYNSMEKVLRSLRGVLKKKKDSCSIIFADRRYAQEDKLKHFPVWIKDRIKDVNPSNQVASVVKQFVKMSALLESETDLITKMGSMNLEEVEKV